MKKEKIASNWNKEKKGSNRMVGPNQLTPSYNVSSKYINVSLKNKNATERVALKVMQILADYNLSNIHNYLNFSITNDFDAESAWVALKVMQRSEKPCPSRLLGSNPSPGATSASSFLNENISQETNTKIIAESDDSDNDYINNLMQDKEGKVEENSETSKSSIVTQLTSQSTEDSQTEETTTYLFEDTDEENSLCNGSGNNDISSFSQDKKWGGSEEEEIRIEKEKNKRVRSVFSNKLLIISLLVILLILPNVLSLGITPGRTTINYEKGLEKEVIFSIMNSEHKNMQVFLTIQGELNKSVTLFDSLVEFMPSEESKQFKYKIKLSDNLEPGLHTAEIVALEVPKSGAGGTYVGATVAVVSQIYVYVPYPGKYLDADLNVLDAVQNSTATFIVPIINRGKLGIGEARAIIDIYTSLNEKVGSVETDYRRVDSGARTELSGKWPVNVNSGNYLAKITLLYDGESRNFEKQFAIGTETLSIESILVNNFQLGEIAKLQILVENKWNQELKSVFANMLVYNNENQVMADVKSAAENIPALSKKELIAYWDTVGVGEGEYNGKLMVKYGEKSADKNLILKVSENTLDIVGVGYAIRSSGGKGMDITMILIVLVVILLIANLSWFVFFRRIIGKKKK